MEIVIIKNSKTGESLRVNELIDIQFNTINGSVVFSMHPESLYRILIKSVEQSDIVRSPIKIQENTP